VFVPFLGSPDTAIVTAASAQTASFGCQAQNDWTYFGDALINHALRKPQPLGAATAEARQLIAGWEKGQRLEPSRPQIAIGAAVEQWLPTLEASIPRERTDPVGAPAISAFQRAAR
jgi:hypothetical protein